MGNQKSICQQRCLISGRHFPIQLHDKTISIPNLPTTSLPLVNPAHFLDTSTNLSFPSPDLSFSLNQPSPSQSLEHYPTDITEPLPSPSTETQQIILPQNNELRRSTRPITHPQHLQAFDYPTLHQSRFSESNSFLATQITDPSSYNPDYVASLSNVMSLKEPTTCKEACQDPLWIAPMNKELCALEDNRTWTLIETNWMQIGV